MNGAVLLKDSSSPAKTVSSPTDSTGKYSFTAAQIQGFVAPFMLEVSYKIGGAGYYLHSAVTAEDVVSGNATINITPLTDLVIANLGNEIAAKIFANGNYSSLLTKTALDGGVLALDSLLQPVLLQMGVAGSVDLLRQSFTANGQGLDAVLDALKVTIDPTTKAETVTNRLDNTSVSGTLSAPPTTPLAAGTTNNVTDLQGITATFNSFAALMATAPAPTSAPLLAFFDQASFRDDGKNLQAFLQEITSDPVIAGGSLVITDLVLESVPSWVTTVPSGATAYKATFTVLQNTAPNDRHDFIMYMSQGTWLILGNQLVAKAAINAFEGDNNGVLCTGMLLNVNDKGGVGINYAVMTGPGLPAAGLLLFNPATTQSSFSLAAGDPTTYNGTNTPQATVSCSYNNVFVMSDAQIQSITTLPAVYTVTLYKDNGTPTVPSDDTLVATYNPTMLALPLQSTALTSALFASNIAASPTVLSAAATGGTVTVSWTAPTASGLYASSLDVYVCNASGCQDINTSLSATATSAILTVPTTSGITGDGATVEYSDSVFRQIWTSPAGSL